MASSYRQRRMPPCTPTINRAGWLVAGVLALFVVAALTGVVSGGPLDPPGAPSATGTLPQVEPRSPIPPVGWNGTFPIVISQPGSYFLTRSLTSPHGSPNRRDPDHRRQRQPSISNGFTLPRRLDRAGMTAFAVDRPASAASISATVLSATGFSGSAGCGSDWRSAVFSRVEHITAIDNLDCGHCAWLRLRDHQLQRQREPRTAISTQYSVVRGCHVRRTTQTYGIYAERCLAYRRQQGVEQRLRHLWSASRSPSPAANTVRSNTSTNNLSYRHQLSTEPTTSATPTWRPART